MVFSGRDPDAALPTNSVAFASHHERWGSMKESLRNQESGESHSTPSGEIVISIRDLVKRYETFVAVGGITLDVRRGEVFAFLGPNGAGKTTTVEILEGFRERTGGEVRVLGVDPAEAGGAWRDRVGVVLQDSAPEPELSVRECLRLFADRKSTRLN